MKTERKERERSSLGRLRKARRRSASPAGGSLIRKSHLGPEGTMPLVIEPRVRDLDLAGWAEGQKDLITTELSRHGAILFRGFGVSAVPEFERFAGAVCPGLYGEYGDLPREEEGRKVYHSTPYPADKTILFHNESSHLNRWPLKQFFFCVQAAQKGGETPLVDCRKIYQALDSSLRERFEREQLMYVRNFTDGLDVSWQEFFKTSDRAVVEESCRQAGIEWCWREKGLETRYRTRAVAVHPKNGEKVFFNQLQLHHVSCLDPEVRESMELLFAQEALPRNVFFGDGSPIANELVQEVFDLYWQHAVSFPWQEGDIVMVDNMLVAHARNPFVGPRKIVVAMGELVESSEI